MKIALAFFGLPRCSPVAFPSIERQLIAPLQSAGELQVFHHLYRQQHVFNPRSAENDAMAPGNYAPFERFRGRMEDRPAGESELLQRLKPYGDAFQDGFHSLTNLLLQLQSLLAVTEMLMDEAPDVVVFARPDLLYHDPLPLAQLRQVLARPDEVVLPWWESWGGWNDRFAIAGARAYRAYGGRLLLADHFCGHTRQPLHSETFLRYALAFAGVPVRTTGMRASRVRVDGRIEQEDFDGVRSPLARASQVRTGPPGP
jgi:hypothetical protein